MTSTLTCTMPPAPARARPARTRLALVVAAIVFGILGMHALTPHGTAHGTPPGPGITGTTDMSGMSGMAHYAVGPAHATAATQLQGADTAEPGDTGHGMGAMLMLCAVMLVSAGALLVLALGWRRSPRVWAHLSAAPATLTSWATARSGTGPPPAWEFSVIRC